MNSKMSDGNFPPAWSLARPKPPFQLIYDVLSAPLRMVVLPDNVSEKLHMTSLRAERFANVLPELRGRCLDVGAGDNILLRLYDQQFPGAGDSVGVDVHDWGGGCTILPSVAQLPFPDESFDTVSFVACINHIPERKEVLIESARVLRPGGRIVITMIGRFIGVVGHALWWYSEDKHREVDEEEDMGMDEKEVVSLLEVTGFRIVGIKRFVYGLNTLYIAEPAKSAQ